MKVTVEVPEFDEEQVNFLKLAETDGMSWLPGDEKMLRPLVHCGALRAMWTGHHYELRATPLGRAIVAAQPPAEGA